MQGDQFSRMESSSTCRKNCNDSACHERCLPRIIAKVEAENQGP